MTRFNLSPRLWQVFWRSCRPANAVAWCTGAVLVTFIEGCVTGQVSVEHSTVFVICATGSARGTAHIVCAVAMQTLGVVVTDFAIIEKS